MKEMVEQHGGKNVSSISNKTSFVLAGNNMGPAKLEKAEKLGIPILSEQDFLGMIGGVRVSLGELLPVGDCAIRDRKSTIIIFKRLLDAVFI